MAMLIAVSYALAMFCTVVSVGFLFAIMVKRNAIRPWPPVIVVFIASGLGAVITGILGSVLP